MKGLRKRIIALAAVAAMVMTTFVGCGSVDNSEIVAKVGDSKITAGMANFYARYQQPSFEEYYVSYQDYQQQQIYGSVMYETVMDWSVEQEEGVTLEDTYKDDVMTSLQNLYIMEDHMKDYDVELTKDELSAIEKAAKKFMKANSDDAKEKISADKETVIEYLKLMTISVKVENAIRAGVDPHVSDEESAQKRIRYVSFATTKTDENSQTVEMTKKEIKAVKKEANEFLEAAKANGNLEAYATEKEATSNTATYGRDYADDQTATLPKEVFDAAEKLEENGFAKVIKTDSAFYVVQLESAFDQEATTAKLNSIMEERKSEAVTDTIEKWRKDTKIKVYDDVWDKISMHDIQVTEKKEETEESTEGTTETLENVTTDDVVEDTTTEDAATEDTATDTTAEDTTTEE